MGGKRVSKPEELEEAFTWLLNYDGPALLDMRIDRDENVFPMVAPGAPLDDIIGATNVGPISHMLEALKIFRLPMRQRPMKRHETLQIPMKKEANKMENQRHILSILVENQLVFCLV